MMDTRKVSEISTHGTFEQLFPIRDELLEKIEQDMREGSYDLSQPVILATWNGQKEPVCIDGHTRLKAANNAGIEELPVWTHEFDTEEEAINKAIMLQQNRRNMSDADILACVAVLDSRRMRGGDRRSEEARSKASSDANENPPAKSAAKTAEFLGISTTKVEHSRTLLDHGDPETIDDVKNGKKSLNKATKEIREKRKKKASNKKPKKQQSEPSEEQLPETTKRMVPISQEDYEWLRKLGGSIEDHVATAIKDYLEYMAAQKNPFAHIKAGLSAFSEETEDDKSADEQPLPDDYNEDDYDD
jgi:ParB family transcriptional regulator, chromosome partitioning protein